MNKEQEYFEKIVTSTNLMTEFSQIYKETEFLRLSSLGAFNRNLSTL